MPPPDSTSDSVIKSGPALVHRKGLHRKRRVWMELSRDFISTFPSAREEDRIRPLHSIMRTSIRVCKLRLPNDNLAFSEFHPEDR